jgi:hypothetical protein
VGLGGEKWRVVEEVVRRSKLAQLALTPPGQKLGIISEQALISSAQTMAHQLDLLKKRSMPDSLAWLSRNALSQRMIEI